MLKMINKDNLLKSNNIDVNRFNSDKVYKIIKKFKIPYNSLTKDSILNLIINFDKNSKNGKIENSNFLLKQKTPRKKTSKQRENLYSEKINKRRKLKNNNNDNYEDNNFKARASRRSATIQPVDSKQSADESDKVIIKEESSENNNAAECSMKIKKKAKPMIKNLKSKPGKKKFYFILLPI